MHDMTKEKIQRAIEDGTRLCGLYPRLEHGVTAYELGVILTCLLCPEPSPGMCLNCQKRPWVSDNSRYCLECATPDAVPPVPPAEEKPRDRAAEIVCALYGRYDNSRLPPENFEVVQALRDYADEVLENVADRLGVVFDKHVATVVRGMKSSAPKP